VVHWLVTGVALFMALGALALARRLGRRLERLTQNYWELRYQHGELRARVRRLDPEAAPENEPAPPPAPAGTFIPLSALKR
jgi:hypothetical protein